MDRMDFAQANRERYLDWIGNVERGPFSALDRLEFAIISAHTPMEKAIRGWLASRNAATMDEVAVALNANSVIAPFNKAAYIDRNRESGILPSPDYQQFRRDVKLPGLGYCKQSFAACLIDPFGADVLCLDVHMIHCIMADPTPSEIGKAYRKLSEYEALEAPLLAEAEAVGLPAFAYQWATWDYTRCVRQGSVPESHSFLWSWDNARFQLPLFSGSVIL